MTLVEYMRQSRAFYEDCDRRALLEARLSQPHVHDVQDPLIDELVGLFDRICAAASAEDATLEFETIVIEAHYIAKDQWLMRQVASAQASARERFPVEMAEALEPGVRTLLGRYGRDDIKAYMLAMLDERPAQP